MSMVFENSIIYTGEHTFSREDVVRYNAILAGTIAWPVEEDSMTIASVAFEEGYELDMIITNSPSNPYLEITIFQEGDEFWGWPLADKVVGCWESVFAGYTKRAFKFETFVK